jgi:hypothetical protein
MPTSPCWFWRIQISRLLTKFSLVRRFNLQSCFADDESAPLQPDAIYHVDTFTDQWFVYGTMTGPGRSLHESYLHDTWDFAERDLKDIRRR